MNKLILSALAASMIASPLAAGIADAAPQRSTTTTVQHRNNGRTVVTKRTVVRQPTHRNWARGQRFDRRYAPNYREIDYRRYRTHHLYAPPRGYHWVRSGNDAVLVGVTSGLVAAVLSGAIR